MRTDGPTPGAVALPPDAPANPYCVSPISIFTADIGRPSVSAATSCTIVRVPVPTSCVPHLTTTPPSEVTLTLTCALRPEPPHWFADTPMPVLIGPGVESPVACR